MEYLSKQRYDEIAAELKHLINEVYPKVKDDLAEARSQGDLSENAGYQPYPFPAEGPGAFTRNQPCA